MPDHICQSFNVIVYLSQLSKIRVGHDGRGRGKGSWFLEEFIIIKRDECWIFPCKKWLSDTEGDGKTERILLAGMSKIHSQVDVIL